MHHLLSRPPLDPSTYPSRLAGSGLDGRYLRFLPVCRGFGYTTDNGVLEVWSQSIQVSRLASPVEPAPAYQAD
jgi:hypothetical protein